MGDKESYKEALLNPVYFENEEYVLKQHEIHRKVLISKIVPKGEGQTRFLVGKIYPYTG